MLRPIQICDDLDLFVAQPQILAALVALRSGGKRDSHQDSLGPDPPRLRDRAHHDVARDAMDRVAAWVPAAAWSSLV